MYKELVMRNKECLKDTMNENKEEVLIKLISYIFIAGGVLVLVGAGVYIFLKKGYWFW